jgi:FkbM family methyltransferase
MRDALHQNTSGVSKREARRVSCGLDAARRLDLAVTSMNNAPAVESFAQNQEDIIAWDYFDRKTNGFFVEVGANDPTALSQTWFLEQRGWKGVLVEPIPACCEKLRAVRTNSIVCQAAAGAPEQVGEAVFSIAQSDVWSRLGEPEAGTPVRDRIQVAVRTLNDILNETKAPRVDLLSIDTEGMELKVLRGFDLQKHRPALVVLEDHMDTLDLFFYMKRQRYRLVKRTGPNNWWVPAGAKTIPRTMGERMSLWNRIWFKKPRLRMKWLLGMQPQE